jgi:DNA-binding NarL/FixJ family response regulator
MTTDVPALTGVVCDDRDPVRRMVAGVLVRCGFEVAGRVADFATLRALVRAAGPTVAVVSLPVAGMTGLGAVRTLRAEAPGCMVVLLCSFDQLQVAALEAGARALVPEEDPQALREVLVDIAAAATCSPALPESTGVSPA